MYDTLLDNVSGSRAGTMFRIYWLATKFQNINVSTCIVSLYCLKRGFLNERLSLLFCVLEILDTNCLSACVFS